MEARAENDILIINDCLVWRGVEWKQKLKTMY